MHPNQSHPTRGRSRGPSFRSGIATTVVNMTDRQLPWWAVSGFTVLALLALGGAAFGGYRYAGSSEAEAPQVESDMTTDAATLPTLAPSYPTPTPAAPLLLPYQRPPNDERDIDLLLESLSDVDDFVQGVRMTAAPAIVSVSEVLVPSCAAGGTVSPTAAEHAGASSFSGIGLVTFALLSFRTNREASQFIEEVSASLEQCEPAREDPASGSFLLQGFVSLEAFGCPRLSHVAYESVFTMDDSSDFYSVAALTQVGRWVVSTSGSLILEQDGDQEEQRSSALSVWASTTDNQCLKLVSAS
jgi:hypothetical protein